MSGEGDGFIVDGVGCVVVGSLILGGTKFEFVILEEDDRVVCVGGVVVADDFDSWLRGHGSEGCADERGVIQGRVASLPFVGRAVVD